MEKKKDNQLSKKRVPWGIIVLLILLAILYFSASNNIDEYIYCIDDCVYDNSDCISSSYVYDNQGNSYIKEYDADSCVSELEDCVSSCEIDYGN